MARFIIVIVIAAAAVAGVVVAIKRFRTSTPPAPVEKNIIVAEPADFATVGAFVTVRGRARVFENTVLIELKDGFGQMLSKTIATAAAPDVGQFGDFSAELYVPVAATPVGTIVVFWSSPKDGTPLDVVSIPVTFPEEGRRMVKVFLTNPERNPETQCDKVFAAEREIYSTERVAAAALWELLRGPTDDDQARSFATSIPEGARLRSISIENGTARADFDETLEGGVGGSCRVASIRAQIAETLKQFSSVHDVAISINGRTEDILQP